jgi:tetratricopeptide (TPR) repeat protein
MTLATAPSSSGPALDCPVCPRTALAPGTLACPNCETGLAPLWRLRDLAAQYYNDGLEAARRGDTESALRKLCCALEFGGDEPSARLVLGKLLWRAGQHAQAVAHWRRVQQLAPAHADCAALLQLAQRRRRTRQLAAALALLLALAAAAAQLWNRTTRSAPVTAPASRAAAETPPASSSADSAYEAVAGPARDCLARGTSRDRPAAAGAGESPAPCWTP